MSARTAREAAMQLLFGYEMTGDKPDAATDETTVLNISDHVTARDRTYVDKLLSLIPEHLSYIDDQIRNNSTRWKIERISKVDLAILRLAILETEFLDVPAKIAVNEAVELAKKYSAEKSYQFVNGVLAGYLKSRSSSGDDKAQGASAESM